MARKRKTKKDEDEGALSPRTVLVALLIAALAAGAAHLLKHPAIVEEWAEASSNLNATARARRRDSELMKLVPAAPHDKSAFDRAVAWCARNWDDESKRVAEFTLERLSGEPSDAGAATTVANLMIRAVEAHMRASNWSATAAISAPSPLRQQYGDVLGSAGSLLRQAADDEDHHGAHYSLALLYKLYPGLVASNVKVEDAAKAGAARACAAERATIRWLKQGSAGRYGVAAALGCLHVRVERKWSRRPNVEITNYDGASVGEIRPPGNHSKIVIQGLDSVIPDLPLSPLADDRKSIPPPIIRPEYYAPDRSCTIYSRSCYPALWRQFDPRNPIDHSRPRELELEEAAVVDGFSGASYYHWLCETVPRLLILGEHLEKTRPNNAPRVPVLLPAGGPHLEATLRLLGRAAFSAFGVLHKREHGTVVRVSQKVFALTWGNDDHPGAASALLPAPSMLRKAREAIVAAALAGPPPDAGRHARGRTTVVLASRHADESRALGNQEAIAAALAHVAAQRNLEFALFDGRVTTLPETVDLFGSAALVVGVHGAGLANALFCVEGAALLELSLPEPEFGEYAHLAGALGLHYASVPLPHSNFEARAWPKPSAVAAAAAALLDA